MRVIGGQFRSRPIRTLRGMDIRPTSDRLRETLFDVLTAGNPQALLGSVWVDLYAGTGAVGIEALSRGAAKVYFVDRAKHSQDMIRLNLKSLTVDASAFEILAQDAVRAIGQLGLREAEADFIFMDPPYAMRDQYSASFEALTKSRLAQRALIIVEHEKKFDSGREHGTLKRFRTLVQGDAALSLYRRT